MKTVKILDPNYDCIFKTIMLDKDNEQYLKKLISLITNIDIDYLENMYVEDVENNIEIEEYEKINSDVIVTVGNHAINLVIKKYCYEIMEDKMTFYDYLNMIMMIQINFDMHSKFKGEKDVYEFIMQEVNTKEVLYEGLRVYHVDLEFIRKKFYEKKQINELEKYCLPLTTEIVLEL